MVHSACVTHRVMFGAPKSGGPAHRSVSFDDEKDLTPVRLSQEQATVLNSIVGRELFPGDV